MAEQFHDIFGIAFHDYLNGEKDAEIIVATNVGDDDVMPIKYFFRNYDELPEMEQIALSLCNGKILDIGGGSGCHSILLQKKGLDISAIDISEGAVEIMKKRGIQNARHLDFYKIENEKYDTLLLLMDSIGLVQTIDGLNSFFKKAKQLLNPGGQIILDSADLMHLFVDKNGSFEINLNSNYYGEVVYQLKYKDLLGEPFKWIFIDFGNLSDIAMQNGFDCEMLYEDDRFNYLARIY
ncbi:MAG: class I SAM-dependent methyltransferase [Saprospiraceae bacterium]|nr:class I SAM-dependent methyltransferase [Saprospiraceae bacterium]